MASICLGLNVLNPLNHGDHRSSVTKSTRVTAGYSVLQTLPAGPCVIWDKVNQL